MSSVGYRNGESKSVQRDPNARVSYTETQPFDSQSSPSPQSGEKLNDMDAEELSCKEFTVPYGDDCQVEDAIKTQTMDLGFETQVLNFADETQVMNLASETQAMGDLDGFETQEFDDLENVIVADSDDEGTDRTEVLDDINEFSDGDSRRRVTDQAIDGEKIQHTSLSNNDKRAFNGSGSGALRNRGESSGVCSTASKGPKVGEAGDRLHNLGDCNEKVTGLKNGGKTVRKLFTRDSPAGSKEHCHVMNNDDIFDLPICDGELAGSSYVESQEPGEALQANALNFVERFINDICLEFDPEVDHCKSTGGKTKHASSVKGPNNLAKKTSKRNLGGGTGTFDWDDNREDEGGGEIFCRRKEEFFGNGNHSVGLLPPSKKFKGRGRGKRGDNEQDFTGRSKRMVHSDSKLALHHLERNDKKKDAAGMELRKNLIYEIDKSFKTETLRKQLEKNGRITDDPEMPEVGVDTQFAAEAMQAPSCGEDIMCHDTNGVRQDMHSNSNVSLGGSISGENGCLSESGVHTRQSMKRKKTDAELSAEPLVTSRKHHKKSAYEVSNVQPPTSKRTRSNADEYGVTDGGENKGNMPSKKTGKTKDGEVWEVSGFDKPDRLNRQSSVKLQEVPSDFSPIARGTRHSIVVSQQKGSTACSISSNTPIKVGALRDDRNCTRDTEVSPLLNAKLSPKVGSNQLSMHENLDPSWTAKVGIASSYPRGRSCRKLSGEVNESDNSDPQSRRFVRLKDLRQYMSKLKSSTSNNKGTSVDSTMRRVTQSPQCTETVFSSVSKDLEGKQSPEMNQNLDKPSVTNAVRLDNSAGNGDVISPTITGSTALKQSECELVADSSPSAQKTKANANSKKTRTDSTIRRIARSPQCAETVFSSVSKDLEGKPSPERNQTLVNPIAPGAVDVDNHADKNGTGFIALKQSECKLVADSSPSAKKTKANAGSKRTSVESTIKRITRSSQCGHTFFSSVRKDMEGKPSPERNKILENPVAPATVSVDSFAGNNGEPISPTLRGSAAAKKFEYNSSPSPKKRSANANSKRTSVDSTLRRITRSSQRAKTVFSSVSKDPEGRPSPKRNKNIEKTIAPDAVSVDNSACNDGEPISPTIRESTALKLSAFNLVLDSSPSAKKTKANAKLDRSPNGKGKPSGSACNTPVYCMTPSNAASPVCTSDEYLTPSCKKKLSMSGTMKELNSLIATDPKPVPLLKDSRRRDLRNVKLSFSHHLDEDVIKQQKKILARLGVSAASSIIDATHFVADKFVRTRNMLEAMASGKPVVTHAWLESVEKTKIHIDEETCILRDIKKEKEIGFSMPVSLARARQFPLLQGWRVFITPNAKPSKETISSLVKAVHGKPVERIGRSALKDDTVPDDLLVISCEDDYDICVPFIERGATIYSPELLLNGIVTQKLECLRHQLFSEHVKRTRSTIRIRKDSGNLK